ncbi:hypothetical protein OYC64_008544 [Pagothenia borchgrevinki]|uniref:Uncharacterized protein n=1 Tax=Pagothenia borchgrevinki TaxID=8213 RepID=A0ABD2G4X2_PAGBO
MESPLLETRACPSCPGLIAGADPHHLCFECLDQDMAEAVPFTFANSAGLIAPFAGEEDDEDFSLSGTSGSGVHGSPPPRSVLPPGDDHGGGAWQPIGSQQAAGWAENLCPAVA